MTEPFPPLGNSPTGHRPTGDRILALERGLVNIETLIRSLIATMSIPVPVPPPTAARAMSDARTYAAIAAAEDEINKDRTEF